MTRDDTMTPNTERRVTITPTVQNSMRIGQFENLPGVLGGKLTGPIVMGGRAAMKALNRWRIVSGSGDHGAWTVWLDDAGAYRCEFAQFREIKNSVTLKSKTDVLNWLKEFIVKCHGMT